MYIWTTTLTCGLVMFLAKGEASCPSNVTETLGLIHYNIKNETMNCTWSLGEQYLRPDVILFIKFDVFRKRERSQRRIFPSGLLPDGQPMVIENLTQVNGNSWCGLYVKRSNNSETACKSGVTIPNKCYNNPHTTESKHWPPRMTTTMRNWILKLVFVFLECPKNETFLPATSTAVTLRGEVMNQSTITNHADLFVILAVTLAALLLVAMCSILVLLAKMRTLKRDVTESSSNNRGGGASEQQNNLYTDHELPGRGMVNNVIYGTTAVDETKQTVNNELYNL